jgi:hypothetical protein
MFLQSIFVKVLLSVANDIRLVDRGAIYLALDRLSPFFNFHSI